MPKETKQTTLSDKIKAIDAKYSTAAKTEVTRQIAGSKSKRGPGLAGRISGLRKLSPSLGQQFSQTNKNKTNEG